MATAAGTSSERLIGAAPGGRPSGRLRHAGPNWFAAVMGTGIVATAAATLPVQPPGLHALATVAWALASGMLLVLVVAAAVQAVRHPGASLDHLRHPVMRHFFGAVPMAVLTVGASTLLVGADVVGSSAALRIDLVLWTLGTALGLVTAVAVPYYAVTRPGAGTAFGGWLMPVVPPMVSAATGALLVPYLPDGQLRVTMLLGCYAMFGLSLAASALVIGRIWDQLLHHGIGPAAMVPTLWIVLGPVGQSITAVNLLANAAPSALPAAYVPGAAAFALFYGLAAWGFAMLWLTIAAVATVRTARAHLPFTLTWWSFTFPVGTLVTAASGLSARTGLVVFTTAAVGLFGFLVVTWAVVLIRTLRGLAAGDLLTPMPLPTS